MPVFSLQRLRSEGGLTVTEKTRLTAEFAEKRRSCISAADSQVISVEKDVKIMFLLRRGNLNFHHYECVSNTTDCATIVVTI